MEVALEDMDMSELQNGATYEQIKGYVLCKTRLKVSSLYISQVKQKYGIIEQENYNKPKSENVRRPQCPKEKTDVIKDVQEYFEICGTRIATFPVFHLPEKTIEKKEDDFSEQSGNPQDK